MINKVDGNNYYTYTKQKKIDIPDTGEKFSLGYKKDELSSGAKDRKEEVSEQEKQQAAEQNGVRLELSSNGMGAGTDRRQQTAQTKNQSGAGQMPLLETIRTFVMTAVAAVMDFFNKIWNDQPPEAEIVTENMEAGEKAELTEADWIAEASETAQTMEASEAVETARIIEAGVMDEEQRNRIIRQSLRDGDMEQVINLLTENGRRTIAKNSTLLTSYDKNGRVVEPNASDRERALYGDRNTWTL